MKYLFISILVALLMGCAEPPKKVIQLETSRVVPLTGKAILFNKKESAF
jgi:hypothetical protein